MKRNCLVVALLLFLSSFVLVNAENVVDKKELNYNMIILADEIQKYIIDQYQIVDKFGEEYPNYFGGIYISDDAKNVIIQIVKKYIPTVDSDDYENYLHLISFNDNIKIEYVDNSFNELNNINNNISNYIEEQIDDNVVGTYIDIMNNKTVVEMLNITEYKKNNFLNKVNKLRTNFKDSAIDIVRKEESAPFAGIETLKAGAEFVGKSAGEGVSLHCSVGFRTKYNNRTGFVTAGHCLKEDNYLESGTILLAQFSNNQKYDYGFVASSGLFNYSNALAYTSGNVKTLAVVNYCPTITVNMSIAKSGYATGYKTGKVKALNQTVTYTSDGTKYVIKGLVKSDICAKGGDSGGPVFIPRDDSNGGAIPIGIISGGGKKVLCIGAETYFTSINDLPEALLKGRY